MFSAMQFLKQVHIDHSYRQNSDIENKHQSFENRFPDQNQIQLEITYSTRHPQHTSALANLVIIYMYLYRAQYITGRQSWLSNEDRVTCAVGILDQKFIN